jgi:hypothetical protein
MARIDGERHDLSRGHALLIPKGTTRAIRAGHEGIRYLSVHQPQARRADRSFRCFRLARWGVLCMDMSQHPGQPRPLRHFDREGETMGLFRSKQLTEKEDERCPNCRERVPEGAVTCMMCGLP